MLASVGQVIALMPGNTLMDQCPHRIVKQINIRWKMNAGFKNE